MLFEAMKLDRDQRHLIADKLMDSANYALAGLVFAQLITDRVRPLILILGLFLYGWLAVTALRLKKGVKKG